MNTNNLDDQDRPTLTFDSICVGDCLVADDRFDCIAAGQKLEVKLDELGLYVCCDDGQHYIDGQCDDGVNVIGFSRPA